MTLSPAFLVALLAISTASAIPAQTQTQIQLSRRDAAADSARARALHPRCARPCGPPAAAELGAGLDEGLLSAPSTAAQLVAVSRVVPLGGGFADGGVDAGVEPIEQVERNCVLSRGVPSLRSRQEKSRASKDGGRRRALPTRDDALARIARFLNGGEETRDSRHALLAGLDEPPRAPARMLTE